MRHKLIADKRVVLALATTLIYFLLEILYFSPIKIDYKIVFPLATLFLGALFLLPRPVVLALLFSAIGDYQGAAGCFLGQMGAFAMTHVLLIYYFFSRCLVQPIPEKCQIKVKSSQFLAVTSAAIALILVAFTQIVPVVPTGILTYGTAIYALLIILMFWIALFQGSVWYALGAGLFLFSDLILAWNKFVSPIDQARYLIMIPYYLGQWMIFMGATRLFCKCRNDK